MTEKLNKERDHVADIIRQEFADRLVATEEENKRLKTDMSELKARHRLELERSKAEIEIVTKAKEEEMDEVHKRYNVFLDEIESSLRLLGLHLVKAFLKSQSNVIRYPCMIVCPDICNSYYSTTVLFRLLWTGHELVRSE